MFTEFQDATLTITPVWPDDAQYGIVVLTGPSSPKGGPGSMAQTAVNTVDGKNEIIRLPGSEKFPTLHHFGYEYAPIIYEGKIKDQHLGIGGCEAVRRQIDRMVKDGVMVLVTLGGGLSITGPETYTAIINSASFTPFPSKARMKYSVTFHVIDTNYDDDRTPALPPTPPMYAAEEAAMRIQIALVEVEAGTLPTGIGVDGLDQVLQAISDVRDLTADIADMLDRFGRIVGGADMMLKNLAGTAQNLNMACYRASQSIANFDLPSSELCYSDYRKLERNIQDLEREVTKTAGEALKIRDMAIQSLMSQGWLAITMTNQDSIEKIAMRTGSDPDKIRATNSLGAAQPKGTTVILVPLAKL